MMTIIFNGYADDFSWICLKDFEFTSFCSQRTTIDTINLLFVCVFYASTIVSLIRRNVINGSHSRSKFFLIVSICCAITSIVFYSIGLWNLIAKTGNSMPNLACIVRGFVWTSLAVSLLVQRHKWIKILNFVWWACSCALVSALNIEILFRKHAIEFFDVLLWLLHTLLLFCAFQNLGYFVTQSVSKSLSEPLLSQEVHTEETGLGHASFLSKLTFSWVNSLLRLGYSKPLSLEDIPSLLSEDKADLSHHNFMHAWESLVCERSKNNTKNLVLWSIVRTHLKENVLIAFYALLRTIAVAVSPLILYAFVNFSNGRDSEDTDLKQGLTIVGFLILSRVVDSVSQRHWFFHSRRSGLKMRSALMVAVYKKQLKLSSSARIRHSAGEIVNYIAVDAYRMGEFPWWFHITWACALQILLSIGILYGVVGVGALPGLVPLLICGLLNVPFAKILQKCMAQFMISQDERLRATSEILNSMKIIKLQSWEDKFKSLIENLRAKEFIWLSKAQIMKTYGTLLYWMSPTIVSAVVFLGCAAFNSAPLNAGTIFTVLATLRNLAEPVRMIPEALSILIQEIQGGNFIWDHESVTPTLRDVNLEIKWGQKVAVCGPVGAGKSSLLYAVLGEIPKISGTDCVMTALREKTVILVTHQVEFLSEVDAILIPELDQNSENKTQREDSEGVYLPKNQSEGEISTEDQLGIQLTQEEEKEIGDVGLKTLWDYISFSRGSLMLSWILLAQFAFIAFQTASMVWLALAIEIPKITSATLIGVYSIISFASPAFIYVRSLLTSYLGLKASKAFFTSFNTAIFNAPMLFFDSTPVGRILTRASSDLSILDFDIPYSITFVASVAIEILAMICVMVLVTWPVFIVAIPAIIASKYVQGYYQASSRELMRINGTTKAPVMNFAAETSLGVVTVRAFNMVERFFKTYLKLVDTDATLFFHSNVAMEWLLLRIEALQNLTVITSALLLILFPQGYVSTGLVGLSLSYALTFTASYTFWTRWTTDLHLHGLPKAGLSFKP
ncbi:hypothetical protein ACSQ67_021644 [Phaseolus vulgaris]